MKLSDKKIWKLRTKKKSDIIFNKWVTVKACHRINWYHALNGIFGELSFSCFLFGPYYSERGVELSVPVVGLGNDYRGTFTLHDHGIEKILEGFLSANKFFHDIGVDLLNPMWYLSFFILFISKNWFDDFIDDFLELLRRELYLLKLLWHFE